MHMITMFIAYWPSILGPADATKRLICSKVVSREGRFLLFAFCISENEIGQLGLLLQGGGGSES